MKYSELAAAARGNIGPYCKACPVCDGRGCRNTVPGPGAKGTGTVAIRNYAAWQDVLVNMDTLHAPFEADTACTVLGRELSLPVMIGPVGDVQRHYGKKYDTVGYNECVLRAAEREGTLAWTGDGLDAQIMADSCDLISKLDGAGVVTVKPWDANTLDAKLAQALAARPAAVAMDIDAAGLPFLKNMTPPAGSKSVAELAEIVKLAERPFIVKGVMTVKGALKAKEAGAAAIVVSNHGGRVLDQCPATAEVLPEIAAALKGIGVKVLVDGGIRTGVDVFKALALGADGVLICRPFVTAVYGGGEEGVKCYIDKLAGELADTMQMCGAHSISEIPQIWCGSDTL